MHIFKNTITQESNGKAFTELDGAGRFEFAPPVEMGGPEGAANPEQMFVTSINTCLLLTLRYWARQKKVEFETYEADIEGQVEKDNKGLRFTACKVKAQIGLKNPDDADKLEELAKLAEQWCLVSKSVNCSVEYQLEAKS